MSSTLLKIDRSVMLSRWVLPAVNDDQIQKLMSVHGLPEIVARLLVAREVGVDEVESYLNPRLARDFPDPFRLQGMAAFAEYLSDAIIEGRKIAAFCDFDVDGSTSAAVMKKFFRALQIDMPFYIPDRMTEGYGPNAKALATLKSQGADIVLMADCGTTAFDVIEQGRELGLDICIFDHHEADDHLPVANHIINPKRKDDTSGLSMLAAVGVTFLAMVAVNTALRAKGYYEKNKTAEPPLKSWLDLVALGTVCDMVPLTGPNRLLVKVGFEQMAKNGNIGLKALCDVGKVKKQPGPIDAGFILGPRINAGSRVHQADLGAKLLSCEDPEEASNLAWLLNDCNAKRRSIQAEMMREAVDMVEKQGLHENPIIFVAQESWHVGLNGLVAGQLKEKYGKPACCIAFAPGMDGRMEGRGSGRSVSGFNLAALFMMAREKGLVLKGGGHAMAAGFTVLPEFIDELHDFFREEAARVAGGVDELMSEEIVDGVASIRGLKPDFIRLLENNVGPFGQENPEPQFVLPFVKIVQADVVGEDHVRVTLTDVEGGTRMKGVAFRSLDTPLGEALLKGKSGPPLHLMGQFKINEWNGNESVEFHIADAAQT
jgi:single-stranded-DNA-specific exonuclease